MRFIYLCIIFLFAIPMFGQSEQLAKNYVQQGEYEKALSVYKKLHTRNPNRITYLLGLVESHQQLEQFEKAEKILQKQIENKPKNAQLLVELGHHYEVQGNSEKATTYYNKALKVFNSNNVNAAYSLAQTFEKYNLLDQAALIYEKGMASNPGANFNVQLAKIYGEQGKLEKMFDSYLSLLQLQPNYKNIVQRNFNQYITDDPLNNANVIFRKLLIKKLQQNPDIIYNEMLSWLFVQQKDFKKAFVQEKAIYKRKDQGLQGIIGLARIAIGAKDIKSATQILDYILNAPAGNDMKLTAHKIILKAKTDLADKKDYKEIKQQYEEVFETYGKGSQTIGLQIDYAHFLAFNQDNKKEAIEFLKRLLNQERLSRFQSSRAKMKIADILVLDQKFNQALIYYTQVQNALKNNFLAQDARFKVAKTSYYKGDFAWAQTQLDVLKSSTSQLIANDAMELSLIISDNSLEDSTQTALKIFARADLLAFQNKNQEAITKYEEILVNHKGEKIEDEAFLRQAKLFEKEKEFEKAKVNYLKIIEFYPDDILVDDAYYWLAELYVNILGEPEKAKELYEKLIFNHADSIYFVDARKKYRTLRGDAIN
ncbi:tetratricopeptide repeat protein [Aquimarina sp. MMG015]|uniref:tetratricopeptide repeat protein n=1 Tax=Aquimarina TaxID=290174 RepID=UPI000484C027|nr:MULTISPECIES: tetratricopeptide repeat protein [Aquimarina]AXT57640.1 tetratricopeptide repeat protein [Aquimarina sp. AD1]MBQ4805784.1 tetratricopeptide repeat protein [Aquimarina sp. MMG015]RKN29028.1 tetratricopeptide repeat protein [Aquimarina sp. AD1]